MDNYCKYVFSKSQLLTVVFILFSILSACAQNKESSKFQYCGSKQKIYGLNSAGNKLSEDKSNEMQSRHLSDINDMLVLWDSCLLKKDFIVDFKLAEKELTNIPGDKRLFCYSIHSEDGELLKLFAATPELKSLSKYKAPFSVLGRRNRNKVELVGVQISSGVLRYKEVSLSEFFED